ncbi:MAG: hypothetical protein JW999_06370 [Methanotrichaceae archaeon]|nr:hypothetical protein [Methanotrichaceae archaeon]
MDNRNEILFAVREAKRNLGEAADFRVADALAILEGIAPFLNKEIIIGLKCKGCDNYASASFPLSRDFWAVDDSEYCHAKHASLKNLTASKLAGCTQYSCQASGDLINLGTAIMEEDLRPAFQERKLYDRSKFASYSVAFRLQSSPGKVCIELGHLTDEGFACSDMKLYILRRLDPGFGAVASQKIFEAMKSGPVMVVQSSLQTRKQLDIDYVLEWIVEKRKMDIVYL